MRKTNLILFVIFAIFLILSSVIYDAYLISAKEEKGKKVESDAEKKMKEFREAMEKIMLGVQIATIAWQAYSYFSMFRKAFNYAKALKQAKMLEVSVWQLGFKQELGMKGLTTEIWGVESLETFFELAFIFFTFGISVMRVAMLYSDEGTAKQEPRLLGTSYCSLCNWDPLTACTPQRCYILGDCYFEATKDERGGICLPGVCGKGLPQLQELNVVFEADGKQIANTASCPNNEGKGCSIVFESIPYNVSQLNISFSLNMPADCRYAIDKKQASFDEMELIENAVTEERMATKYAFSIPLKGLARGEEHYIFLKCKGPCGTEEATHPAGYDWNFVKFKIEDWPDYFAPDFTFDPPTITIGDIPLTLEMNAIAVSDQKKYLELWVYLDKQGSCGYSTPLLNLTSEYLLDKDCSQSTAETKYMCHFGTKLEGDFVINSKCEDDEECKYYLFKGFAVKKNCTKCFINISLQKGGERVNWVEASQSLQDIGKMCESGELQQAQAQAQAEMQVAEGQAEGQAQVKMEGCKVKIPVKEAGVETEAEFDLEQQASYAQNLPQIFGEENAMFRLRFVCANKDGYRSEPKDYNIMVMPSYNITIFKPFEGQEIKARDVELVFNTTRLATCSYSVDIEKPFSFEQKQETGFAMEHFAMLKNLTKGQHTVYVVCRDIFNIEEKASVSFKIVNMPRPNIIRFFTRDSRLIIETDVPSICGYSIDNCNFSIGDIGKVIEEVKEEIKAEAEAEGQGSEEDGSEAEQIEAKLAFKKISPFKSLNDLIHETYSNEADVYYVKCTDIMQDNEPECVEVRPFSISK
jgi:hypothetical protein